MLKILSLLIFTVIMGDFTPLAKAAPPDQDRGEIICTVKNNTVTGRTCCLFKEEDVGTVVRGCDNDANTANFNECMGNCSGMVCEAPSCPAGCESVEDAQLCQDCGGSCVDNGLERFCVSP